MSFAKLTVRSKSFNRICRVGVANMSGLSHNLHLVLGLAAAAEGFRSDGGKLDDVVGGGGVVRAGRREGEGQRVGFLEGEQ